MILFYVIEESQKEEPSDDMDTENIPDEENRENTDDKNDEEMSPEEKEVNRYIQYIIIYHKRRSIAAHMEHCPH